jgi:catechol 2,3-dioxygenase-like lactoylglutathione lyase family enzyme
LDCGAYFEDETAVGYGIHDGEDLLCLKLNLHAQAPGPGFHLAFAAPSRQAVQTFYAAALGAGGIDNGPLGLRAHYGPNYYAAFVIDPDGYRVEAVIKGRYPVNQHAHSMRVLSHFCLEKRMDTAR